MVPETAFERSTGIAMLYSTPFKYLHCTIVHFDRKRNNQRAFWIFQYLVNSRVKIQVLRRHAQLVKSHIQRVRFSLAHTTISPILRQVKNRDKALVFCGFLLFRRKRYEFHENDD